MVKREVVVVFAHQHEVEKRGARRFGIRENTGKVTMNSKSTSCPGEKIPAPVRINDEEARFSLRILSASAEVYAQYER